MFFVKERMVKDLNGLIVMGVPYSDLEAVFCRFDPEKPLRYIVFEAKGGGFAAEFFDQEGRDIESLAEELRVVNPDLSIDVETREEGLERRARFFGRGQYVRV